jgi:hypothetical protein
LFIPSQNPDIVIASIIPPYINGKYLMMWDLIGKNMRMSPKMRNTIGPNIKRYRKIW